MIDTSGVPSTEYHLVAHSWVFEMSTISTRLRKSSTQFPTLSVNRSTLCLQWHALPEGVPDLVVYTAFFYFSTSFFAVAILLNIIMLCECHMRLICMLGFMLGFSLRFSGRAW